jgi:alpha-tubulin suppressor-like RCC1 family protein
VVVPGTGPEGDIIVSVALGQRHSLLLTSQGKVLVAGDNSDGQCAKGEMKTKDVEVGKTNEEVETCSIPLIKDFQEINYSGPPVIKVTIQDLSWSWIIGFAETEFPRFPQVQTSRCCSTSMARSGRSETRSSARWPPGRTAATTLPVAR